MRPNLSWTTIVFLSGTAFGATFAGCVVGRSRAEPPHESAQAHATGIGGVFFKAKDPKALMRWYSENLGFPTQSFGAIFEWRRKEAPDQPGSTTWAPFPADTKYFDPTVAPFMINYRVTDLDATLANLRKSGARVDEKVESDPNGRFGWAVDPEGNRFELWEPKAGY